MKALLVPKEQAETLRKQLLEAGYMDARRKLKVRGNDLEIPIIDNIGNGIIIEILHTESESKFSEKEANYPLPIIRVDTNNFDIDAWVF